MVLSEAAVLLLTYHNVEEILGNERALALPYLTYLRIDNADSASDQLAQGLANHQLVIELRLILSLPPFSLLFDCSPVLSFLLAFFLC